MSDKRKILFIVNPISGVKKRISIEDLTQQHLDLNKFDPEIYYTTAKGDGIKASNRAVSENFDAVVAIGGDGTINEVAQGLINSKVALGIVPRGSGNGFANYFGIPHDATAAIKVINKFESQCIDTGLLNDKLFLNVAGLGFDARVTAAFDVFGKRGLLSYMYISFKEYFNFNPGTYTLELDGNKITTKAFLVTAANSTQFGNNAYIAPQAKIDDGLLDIVILKPAGFFQLIGISARLFLGNLHKSRYCEIHRVKELSIAHNDAEAQVDGEPISIESSIHVKIQTKSLHVIA